MYEVPMNACRERHVKVAVRMRPMNENERKEDELNRVITINDSTTTVQTGDVAQPRKEFHFDACYQPLNTVSAYPAFQDETIMNDFGSALCRDAFRGCNGCAIAYGQTGSGKTHTMMGTKAVPGFLRRCIQEIFRQKARVDASGDARVHVWVSFVELYAEQVRDLLVPGPEMKDMKIIDHPMIGPIVARRIESPCETLESAMELIDYAHKKRIIACTTLNATSTRSHAICGLRIVTKVKQEEQLKKNDVPLQDEKVQSLRETMTMAPAPKKDKETFGRHSRQGSRHEKDTPQHPVTARLYFVDLAGSEKFPKSGLKGSFLTARRSANTSIQALSMVIDQLKLGVPRSRIPFRSSKLTFLLRDALGGNCNTCLIATIAPMRTHREETLRTLAFAEQMREITSLAKVNLHKKLDLREEINRLTTQIKQMTEPPLPECAVLQSELRSELAEYEHLEKRMKKTYKGRLAEEEVLKADRTRFMKELGISLDNTDALHWRQAIYLTNVSTDPAFTGTLAYYLKDGSSLTVGNSTDCDIVIRGLGMRHFMCTIKTDGRRVTLCMIKPRPEREISPKHDLQIRVNGELCKEEEHVLKDMDIIYFSKAMALRLCLPNGLRRQPSRAQVHDERLTAHFGTGDSPSFLDLRICVGDLRDRMGAPEADALVAKVGEMAKLVDEANHIAFEMRSPDNMIHLEVELVWDVNGAEPEDVITIRVAQLVSRPNRRFEPPPYPSCLFFWTVAKFLERLDLMREKFDEFIHSQYQTCERDAGTPCFIGVCNTTTDPWLEPSAADIALAQHMAIHDAIQAENDLLVEKETLSRNASARSRVSLLNLRSTQSTMTKNRTSTMTTVSDQTQNNSMQGRSKTTSRDLGPHLENKARDTSARSNGDNKTAAQLAKTNLNLIPAMEKQGELIEVLREQIRGKNHILEVQSEKIRRLEETLSGKDAENACVPQKKDAVHQPPQQEHATPTLKRVPRSTVLGTARLNPPVLFPPRQLLHTPSNAKVNVRRFPFFFTP